MTENGITEIGEREWISEKQNNGDFDYYLIVEITDMIEEAGSEFSDGREYMAEVSAVSPQEAGEEEVRRALECAGYDTEDKNADVISEEMKSEVLHNYGCKATLWYEYGSDEEQLLIAASEQVRVIPIMFGFLMDKPQNAIGSTGWDFLRGDISAGLDRWKEEQGRDEEPGERY